MGLSYEFSIGSVRAKECSLFSGADIEQMLSMKSSGDLFRYLSDKGYGEGDNVDELIESNSQKMWSYLKSVAPDMSVFDPFIRQNDIHNIKTIIKGLMSGRDTDELMAQPASVPPEKLRDAAENHRFDKLPGWIADAAEKSYTLLAQTKDARLSDALIDRAYLDWLGSAAEAEKNMFLAEYFRNYIFYADIKLMIRAARTSASRDYLERAVSEVDGLDKPEAVKRALSGFDQFMKYLAKLDAYDCRQAIAAYNVSPSEFERFVDNRLMALTRRCCRYASEGASPMLGYYLACENERKLIHIIDGGIRTDTPPDRIRERLRDTYG